MNKPIFILALADIVGIVGVCIILVGLWVFVENQNWSQVRRVNVFNFSPYMEDLKIEAIIKNLTSPGYFKVNMKKLDSQLANVNFVRGASIVRSWPMSFNIYLEAQKPLAYYFEDDQQHIVNIYGELFRSRYPVEEYLPTIRSIRTGDQRLNLIHQKKITNLLKNWQPKLLNINNQLIINQLVLNHSLSILVHINQNWQVHLGQYQTNNKNISINNRFQNLIHAIPKLIDDFGINSKLAIDMRYPSSMAVARISND